MDKPDSVTFIWRKIDDRDPWQLTVVIKHSQDCINMVVRYLKTLEIGMKKGYEKRRKIMERYIPGIRQRNIPI